MGLPSRFQEAMHRRLGQTGIFVEVNGKYYLDEARLAQVNKSNSGRGVGGMGGRQSARETLFGLRMARLVIGIVVILLIFSNLFFLHSFMTWFLIGGLLLIVVVISVLQLYYLSKARRMWRSSNFPSAVSEVQMSIN
ncbi:MAG TPA: hypothetical protein VED17_02320 [Nitrososphaerales archaeon]|nr:hypothetical protein [Nitrososphaerales archaeon]